MAVTSKGTLHIMTAASDAVTGKFKIRKIKWIGDDIADGDVLILHDTAGNVIYHHIATADDTGCESDFDGECYYWVTGITVNTMTSDHGTLYVFFE